MDNNFYNKLQKDVVIEKNAFLLALKTLTYEKIDVKKVVLNIICLTFSIISMYIISNSNTTKNILELILSDAFSFAVGITGFLVAGFSLFFTMIQSETMYALLLLNNNTTNENMFKSILLAFIKPFIFLIFIIAYNFTYKIIRVVDVEYIRINNFYLYNLLTCFLIFTLIFCILKTILELIYFIYNIYAFIMFIAKDLISQRMINNIPDMNYSKYISILEERKNDKLVK